MLCVERKRSLRRPVRRNVSIARQASLSGRADALIAPLKLQHSWMNGRGDRLLWGIGLSVLECAPTRRGALDLRKTSGALAYQGESILSGGRKISLIRESNITRERLLSVVLLRRTQIVGSAFPRLTPGAKGLPSREAGLLT
jgi:hypothetical protein